MALSKISEIDVFQTYKSAYSIKIPWDDIFEPEVYRWLQTYEMGKNCSLNLVIPALLSLTSCVCGPDSKIIGQENGFVTSMNSYLLAVCDPGGGKSVTYSNVIEPVLDYLFSKTGKKMGVENYTSAGLQRHQISNKGYGLITTDEGNRFLSSVNQKQSKGESERSNLCKMWSGKGDQVELAAGGRGFTQTSLSMCIFIQPHPMMTELSSMMGNDGFLDRFLMVVSRPLLHSTSVVKENYRKLSDQGLMTFTDIFYKMYEQHKNGVEYKLSVAAQRDFDEMSDAFAEYLNEKYIEDTAEEEDDDKENVPLTQTNLCMTSSKDMVHVLRLAALLSILSRYILNELRKEQYSPEEEISQFYLDKARRLYQFIAQQKSVFVQALKSINHVESTKVRRVQSFSTRISKGIAMSKGPLISVRELQRKLKGSLKDSIVHELETLQNSNFGSIVKVGKREVFLKPSPSVYRESEYCRKADVKAEDYESYFKNIDGVDRALLAVCLPRHRNHDEIIDMFDLQKI